MPSSPFLELPSDAWLTSNALAFAIFDRFPVSPGHTLIITKRLVPTWFDATTDEQLAILSLVNDVKQHLDATLQPKPAGYNVGFNVGEAAGQTVMHLHVHAIPRYVGDMPDPRGGVRHVIPSKGNYLAPPPASSDSQPTPSHLQLITGYPQSNLWDQLSHRLPGAQRVDLLASFVQKSGLDVIQSSLFQLLRSPSQVRIMISDYLFISDPTAIKRLEDWQELVSQDEEFPGTLHVRLVETAKLPGKPESFHPKSWRIIDNLQSLIAVGSSNLSRPALKTGIEWNLLSTSFHDLPAHATFDSEFDHLWNLATPLTEEVATQYAKQATEYRQQHFEPETQDHRLVLEPRPWQVLALKSLQKMRDAGCQKALVAVATGMGKTWLAAFDVRQVGLSLHRSPRVLIIAHRSHILVQAESALATILEETFGDVKSTWYIGQRSDLSGSLVMASIQKLARPDGLTRLANETFDYAIIDEVHHAHAPTYRRVLAQLNATFVLGLTATPERSDGLDVASIFDDNLAHHATIGDGIAEESLVPFHYVGIRDTVDFEQIPWRNGKFDPEELEKRVAHSERMHSLWTAMQSHPGDRTLVFCCSRRHALFARDWLRRQGVTAAAVFSGEGSDGQVESLTRLRNGELQVLCVVDMFNEGLDIPAVDRVIMLRPTESKVIFLQQLGRGLRASEGKARLLVLDFVGNHRIFAQRMLHLLSLGRLDASLNDLKKWLQGQAPDLPPGCLLEVSLEARDLIAQFLPRGSQAGLETYRALRDELGRRPLATELFSRHILPQTVSQSTGSWFHFVASEGDLLSLEQEVLTHFSKWFATIETTSLNKSYKMVVLRVLLDHGNLFKPVDLATFSKRCRTFLLNHAVLRRDLLEGKHELDHQSATDEQWAKWWRKWPIDRWLDVQNGDTWFELSGNRLRCKLNCPAPLQDSLEAMTEELVDWRLAAYAKSHRLLTAPDSELAFEAKVSHAGGRAILFLPETTAVPNRPTGVVDVLLPDQSEWQFKFVKVACNIAYPVGTKDNQLSDLLKSWFGDHAGLPGTHFKVAFVCKSGTWSIRPLDVASPQAIASPQSPSTPAPPPVPSSSTAVSHVSNLQPSADMPNANMLASEMPTANIPNADIPTADIPTADIPASGIPTANAATADIRSSKMPSSGMASHDRASDDNPSPPSPPSPVIEITVSEQAKFQTHAPVYDLVAAASSWGEEGVPEAIGWVRIDKASLEPGMFVARVVGQSMEPTIPDGAWCLFRPCPAGSRQNRLLLVQVNTHLDPIDGGRYTIKKYHSVKHPTADGWQHHTIQLLPLNPTYSPITLTPDSTPDLRIIGEFVAVV